MSGASPCVPALTPVVMGASLVQTGSMASAANGTSTVVQQCPIHPSGRLPLEERKALDNKLICMVMCCCKDYPAVGAADQNLMQGCADSVFESADAALGWQSRYKSEISYVMRPLDAPGGLPTGAPPAPLMSQTTVPTRPSQNWIQRASQALGSSWEKGSGMVRRPDLIIVDNPCLPPVQSNIERVAELKFGGDQNDADQNEAYQKIAGGRDNYDVFRAGGKPQEGDSQICDCSDDQYRRLVQVTTQEAQKQAEQQAERAKNAATAAKAGAVAAALMGLGELAAEVGPWLLAALAAL